MKLSGPGLFFVGRFLITVSISTPVMDLQRFSISSWFSFGRVYFSKKFVHFFQVVQFYWHKLLIVCCYGLLYFSVLCCDFSIFISNFIDFWFYWFFSLFFLMSLANGLSILFIFSKNQPLVLLIFAIVSFISFFTYFCSDFYDFVPSTNFRILLFFF